MKKREALRSDLASAVTPLDEALALPVNDIVRDLAIQRFEIAFELCWKYLKAFLETEHNVICTSPRSCFRAAFRTGVIADDPFWIELTALRNYTVHTYNESLAEYVYGRLPDAAARFRTVLASTSD